MRLFHDPLSTSSRPIVMFAEEHGVPLELELVSLMQGAHKSPEYLAVNPHGVVPMLEDGDLRLIESSAILKYLADKVGSPAYPLDLKSRARINATMDWLFGFHGVFGLGYAYLQMLPQYAYAEPAMQAAALERGLFMTRSKLDVLDAHMIGPKRNYCCGAEFTLADYLGASIFSLADAVGLDLSPWPNVSRWIATLKARPSFGKSHGAFYQLAGKALEPA